MVARWCEWKPPAIATEKEKEKEVKLGVTGHGMVARWQETASPGRETKERATLGLGFYREKNELNYP